MDTITLYLLNPMDNQSARQIIWTEHPKDALQAVSFSIEHAKAIRAGKTVKIPLATNYRCQLLNSPQNYQIIKQIGNLLRIRFEGKEFHLYHRLAKKLS